MGGRLFIAWGNRQSVRMDGMELLVGNSGGLQIDEKQRFIDLKAAWIQYC